MEDDTIRVEYVDFEEVKKWPRNPKDHDLHEIRKSFNRFGFIKPVLLDEGTGQLVAGHGRLETLRLIRKNEGEPPRGVKVSGDSWLVPVLRGVEFKDAREAEAFLLADNRLSEIGGWNKNLLDSIIGEMSEVDGMLEGIGFDDLAVDKILEQEKLKEEVKEVREYTKVHLLISFPPERIHEVSKIMEQLEKFGDIQFETEKN
jgi:hypothetical protein